MQLEEFFDYKNQLLDDIFTTLRLEISDAEKQNFYKKYIQSMTLHIDKDGIMKIRVIE